ncbi:MAG: PIN domain-containing protein [Planctomycetes bacterium]|nr:PIN domain-containing protein [Planctomycetota bacterium]MBI3843374.1 PIN domain-containing protein [Planctomycetota bacterium]
MTDSIARVFIDTNVLVYAYDADVARQAVATELIERLSRSERGVISAQVLAEFYSVSTRKLAARMTPNEGEQRIRRFRRLFPVLDVTALVVAEAARGVAHHGIAFWDAMIWATCRLNQVSYVVTEDVPAAKEIEGVAFFDPFSRDFKLSRFL